MSTVSISDDAGALPRLLDNMAHILRKSEANAEERNIDAEVFLNARLAPDMWPLKKQVQIVAALCKNAPYRIAGLEAPNYEGNPETFEDCYAVLERAKSDMAKVTAKDLQGREETSFTLKISRGETEFTGRSYLSDFTLPNVHFHSTTAYNILRQNGVPLGKADYFGGA